MALAWRPIDVSEDPDAVRFTGDPGDLVDAADLLLALADRPAWMADAACREHPEVTWFPPRGGDSTAPKAICAGCLVRDECGRFAFEQRSWLAGIWAGTSERSRKRLRNGDLAA